MTGAYATYFANFFLTLVISRPNFRGLAHYTLAALQQARAAGRLDAFGAVVDAVIAELTAAIAAFDVSLTDRNDPTAGDTEAFRQARTALLNWVQEQQVRVVNPALYGRPAYRDFRRYTRGQLATYRQQELMTQTDELVQLYTEYAKELEPRYAMEHPSAPGEPVVTMVQRATALAKALRTADATRDSAESAIATSIVTLKSDWVALARALRHAKAALELTFDTDEEVYAFFDFSKARPTKGPKKPSEPTV